MRKHEYYCDCCNKQVDSEKSLSTIWITFGTTKGLTSREVCHDCWHNYNEEIAKVAKKMFK
ncbi:alkyl hydroperoxide reductase/Thiol specific antioxidant/Mal allergen (Precursor) [Clostridium botulinum B str. Osaka05]|uniref:Alkyl hydroperoxide reductase/Thiol specific antioxidant/Mal allergen (Precursor) n=1 Tax=Clostridium botulinum B str. Osaka05 TaxID=1407017 RepID=A0A060N9F5_CLOBO|nr:hypothetical protein [Clostridium botulinum]BAO04804.1 alkyl hydroperoxide reductase/Thiol specific antioxidant/Mal allergen (Precursor) [Clostridium botulinum B str. Osaka05]